MTKRKVYKNYRKRRGGQHYWVGRKGIAKSITKRHPSVTEREASDIINTTFEGIKSNLKREKRYQGLEHLSYSIEKQGLQELEGIRLPGNCRNLKHALPRR